MPPVFDEAKCIKCGKCVANCPGYVLEMGEATPRAAFPDECWHCGCCRIACDNGAIGFEFPLHTRL
ncbi:MAG TPA: 4Fe-4S binding protein [Candidatus Mailhella excrementigallinarum]|nr:MAG: 4Fe-4S ferredoxin [Desulfovibrionaceae bacterium]HIV67101.1 4Fe-4S binding protein [Candidatus Mailhella excrementigallinarum]